MALTIFWNVLLTIGKNMFQAGPLKQKLTSLNVKLCHALATIFITYQQVRTLNDGINNPLLLRASSPLSEVHRSRLVDLNQSRLLIDDMELVLIGQLVIAGTKLTDSLIVLVKNGRVTVTVAIARVVVTLKAKEDILALPASLLEVGSPDGVVAVAGPNQLSVIAEDVRCSLTRAVLLSSGVWETSKWSDEEVALLDVLSSGDGDVKSRRRQIGPRLELPVRSYQRQQGGG
jgi:hypothetical protein